MFNKMEKRENLFFFAVFFWFVHCRTPSARSENIENNSEFYANKYIIRIFFSASVSRARQLLAVSFVFRRGAGRQCDAV